MADFVEKFLLVNEKLFGAAKLQLKNMSKLLAELNADLGLSTKKMDEEKRRSSKSINDLKDTAEELNVFLRSDMD